MNMTPDKLIKSLRICSDLPTGNSGCAGCMFASLYEPACTDLLLRHAADQIERDQKEIEALRAKLPKWISVKERLPIDRLKKYLVAFRDAGGSIVDMARYFPSDGWTCDNWDVPQNLITHWMPLPEPPKEN